MTKIILETNIRDHVLLGYVEVDTDDLYKPNWAGSGKTAKQLILEDPDKTGYTKAYIDKLAEAGVFTEAEKNAAKAKASK